MVEQNGTDDEALADTFDARPVDAALELKLQLLAKSGLPEQPASLALANVEWGHAAAPEIVSISVEEDGTLRLEAEPPTPAALVSDPADWDSTCFAAHVEGHGPLVIEQGAANVIRATYGSNGSTTIAALHGWRWSATSNTVYDLWCAPLKFPTGKPPMVLWRRDGNMVLATDTHLVRGWRFDTGRGQVFLVPNQECWYLAIECATSPPDAHLVHLVRSLLGFVFGEPLSVGLFQPIGEQGPCPGLLHLGLLRHRDRDATSQPPALCFDCEPTWTAAFVDALFRLVEDEPQAPILEVIHLYFASLTGFVESNFLHAWVGLETLARWGIQSGRIADAGPLRLANHDAWLAWVNAHRGEIRALAASGHEEGLVARVQSSEFGSPTRVQRAFRGLGIPWTDEMEDAEQVRHGVAHAGAMSSGPRDWSRDRARVGLVKTMLIALVARIVGYEGPIADRSRTCFNISAKAEPAWWKAATLKRHVDHRGRGVDEIADQARADLKRLEAEEHLRRRDVDKA